MLLFFVFRFFFSFFGRESRVDFNWHGNFVLSLGFLIVCIILLFHVALVGQCCCIIAKVLIISMITKNAIVNQTKKSKMYFHKAILSCSSRYFIFLQCALVSLSISFSNYLYQSSEYAMCMLRVGKCSNTQADICVTIAPYYHHHYHHCY